MLNLELKDLDFDNRILHVRQGKNYQDRYVPISKAIAKSIQHFAYQHRRSFSQRPQKLCPVYGINEAFKRLLPHTSPSLQAKNPTLHSLRHAIATHLLQNGMPIEQIARFLGHNSLVSTQLYTHILDQE